MVAVMPGPAPTSKKITGEAPVEGEAEVNFGAVELLIEDSNESDNGIRVVPSWEQLAVKESSVARTLQSLATWAPTPMTKVVVPDACEAQMLPVIKNASAGSRSFIVRLNFGFRQY